MAKLQVKVFRSDIMGALEIVSLCPGRPGEIYGGLTGAHGHLFFRFDLAAGRYIDLGQRVKSAREIRSFSGHPISQKIHHALVRLPDSAGKYAGFVAGATGQNYSVVGLYTDLDDGGTVFLYDPDRDRTIELGTPSPHEWIINMTSDAQGRNLYGMTYPLNHVFRVDLKKGDMRIVGQPMSGTFGDSGPCHECCCDEDGVLYGSGTHGHIWKYDPRQDKIVPTAMRLPPAPPEWRGRPSFGPRIDSFVRGPDGWLYAGTWETGHLVRIRPGREKIEVLGQPARPKKDARAMRLPAMAWRPDGRLYGAAGGGQAYASHNSFIFRYDPRRKRIETLGTIKSGKVVAERVHTMICGDDGLLYAGETGSKKAAAGEVALDPNLYVIRIVD